MGYYLTIWDGPLPEDDEAAIRTYQELTRRYLVSEPEQPTPALERFGAALAAIWTDDPTDPAFEHSPWKWLPVLDGASGPVVQLEIVFRRCGLTSGVIAMIAKEHGLVCFDPQVGWLRPAPDELSDDFLDRWQRAQWDVAREYMQSP